MVDGQARRPLQQRLNLGGRPIAGGSRQTTAGGLGAVPHIQLA